MGRDLADDIVKRDRPKQTFLGALLCRIGLHHKWSGHRSGHRTLVDTYCLRCWKRDDQNPLDYRHPNDWD